MNTHGEGDITYIVELAYTTDPEDPVDRFHFRSDFAVRATVANEVRDAGLIDEDMMIAVCRDRPSEQPHLSITRLN